MRVRPCADVPRRVRQNGRRGRRPARIATLPEVRLRPAPREHLAIVLARVADRACGWRSRIKRTARRVGVKRLSSRPRWMVLRLACSTRWKLGTGTSLMHSTSPGRGILRCLPPDSPFASPAGHQTPVRVVGQRLRCQHSLCAQAEGRTWLVVGSHPEHGPDLCCAVHATSQRVGQVGSSVGQCQWSVVAHAQ